MMADKSPLLSKSLHDNVPPVKEQEAVIFKSRWLMLVLVTLLTVDSITQWIFYGGITQIIKHYFDVSIYAAEYLTMSGMLVFVVFLVPCVWIVEKTSLRTGCLLNGTMNTIAAVVKYVANYFPSTTAYSLTLTGQIITSIATCFILAMPAELAAMWFGQNERSVATSVVASGHFVGISLSCLLSVFVIANNDNDHDHISTRLEYGQLFQAVFSFLLTVAVYFLFKSKPSIPPSKSQAKLADNYGLKLSHKESLCALIKNVYHCVFSVAYGMIFGTMFAFWLITQEAIPQVIHGHNYESGLIGAVAGILGIPGMLISGFWLDKTKTYKSSLVLVSFLTVLTSLAFTLQLQFSTSIIGIYIVAGIYGFLVASFISMGLVFGSEITYPIPESFSSGLLFMSSQIFGAIFTATVSAISSKYGVVASGGTLTGVTFLAWVLILFVKSDFKRFAEDQMNNNLQD